MSTDRALVLEALQAMTIQPPARCAWFGRGILSRPGRTRWTASPDVARAGLLEAMRHHLYECFYCQGRAGPEHDLASGVPGTGDAVFMQALSDANSGEGSCESGWTVRDAMPGRTVVERAGLQVWVRAADIIAATGGPVRTGSVVALPMPKELRWRSPGFYMALGDEDLGEAEGNPVVRLYWNLHSQGAPLLVRLLTTQLGAARLPYRFKVLNAPASFTRCDAAVLYFRKRDYPRVAPIAEAAHFALGSDLKPRTPAMTKQLAPGLSLAEEPTSGESFGMHRCTLLAEAILQAHNRGARSLEDRLGVVAARFAEEGLDLAAPFLNAGSTDVYARLPLAEAER
jgi:hypothetical protein